MTEEEIKARLQYLKKCIIDENISYGEIAELQSLAKYIDKGDTDLLEWAGVPEFTEEDTPKKQKTIQIVRDIDNDDILLTVCNQENIEQLYNEYRVWIENNESYDLSVNEFENWLLNEKEIILDKVNVEEIFV